jgi:hypothetical protein
MWSSVVLLKCDVVGLSLDERNDIMLNNFIPIAHTGQISGDNNQWCSHFSTTWLDQCVTVAKHALMQMMDTHATDFGNV